MDIYDAPKPVALPVFSCIYALLISVYFYVFFVSGLEFVSAMPAWATLFPVPEILVAAFPFLLAIELRKALKTKRAQAAFTGDVQEQMFDLIEKNKALQAQTHIHQNHKEKLKFFISEKLSEFIEHDEKFLHFKNIAAEVRRLGMTSHDQAYAFLFKQWQIAKSRSIAEAQELEAAMEGMTYFWDLLDLCAVENTSLHISNQLCSAGQRLVQPDTGFNEPTRDESEPPTFFAESALFKALQRSFGETPEKEEAFGAWSIPNNKHVWIRVESTDELFGNENHIVFALENIIRNAQHYAGVKFDKSEGKNARISLELAQQEEDVCYRVYNHGVHIPEGVEDKIFGLGFSTREAVANDGKGLGLYFVAEISRGYSGQLCVENIVNKDDVLSLRIELINGDVVTEVLKLVIQDDLPYFQKNGAELVLEEVLWSLHTEIASFEITHQSDQKTHRFTHDALLSGRLDDPAQKLHPRWSLSYNRLDASEYQLGLKALDISGVEFELRLPSLTSRLNKDSLRVDVASIDDDIQPFTTQFRALGD